MTEKVFALLCETLKPVIQGLGLITTSTILGVPHYNHSREYTPKPYSDDEGPYILVFRGLSGFNRIAEKPPPGSTRRRSGSGGRSSCRSRHF